MDKEGESLQPWLENPGWRGKVGFIAPPSLSMGPMEFLRIAPEGFAVLQTLTHVPNFRVETEFIRQAASQLEGCALALKGAGVDIIAQSGAPYAFVNEDGLKFTRDLHTRLEELTGLPVVIQGLAIINSLKKMGYGSVAVACTSYNADLAERYTRFLEDAGLRVLAMESWVSQGLYTTQEQVDHSLGLYPMGDTYKAARVVDAHAPGADCVLISGGGVRAMDLLEALEEDLGKPVVSNAAAQFWEIFVRLGVWPSITGRGSLLASLEKGP